VSAGPCRPVPAHPSKHGASTTGRYRTSGRQVRPRCRGKSQVTTWAYKFFIFEVPAKIDRDFGRQPGAPLDDDDWQWRPDRFGFDPSQESHGGSARRAVPRRG
jgi:hypothetical protein